MLRQETLALENLPRLYNLIDPSGVLGYFGEDKSFIVDSESSWKFVDLIAQLLRAYRQNPDQEGLRIALVYRPLKPRNWTSETLVLTDDVLLRLYPPPRGSRPRESRRTDPERPMRTDDALRSSHSGAEAEMDGLTEFQRRNREKSVHRGIELLLEYRSPLAPDTPIFCPVLFDRHTTLDQYRTDLEVDDADRQAALPVFEVLNLIGLLPLQQRKAPEIRELNDKLHRLAVNMTLRKPSELRLEHPYSGTPAAPVGESDPYRFETGKSKRETTPP